MLFGNVFGGGKSCQKEPSPSLMIVLHTDLHKIIESRENQPGSVTLQSIYKTSQVIKAII